MQDGNLGNLGDIQDKSMDSLETLFDQQRQAIRLPRRKWIISPQFDWRPPQVKGLEAMQAFYEDHQLPRQWQLLMDFWTKMQKGVYFTKGPNWIEPPVTAVPLDIRTETAVVLPAIGTVTTVLTYTVPDRVVGTLLSFGHELSAAAQWGNVQWTLQINKRPLLYYQNFLQQIGTFVDPTPFPAPHRLKHGDIVELTGAVTNGVASSAFARLAGFVFPVRMVTQDGSFEDYRTL